jgi:hypothetical protein
MRKPTEGDAKASSCVEVLFHNSGLIPAGHNAGKNCDDNEAKT